MDIFTTNTYNLRRHNRRKIYVERCYDLRSNRSINFQTILQTYPTISTYTCIRVRVHSGEKLFSSTTTFYTSKHKYYITERIQRNKCFQTFSIHTQNNYPNQFVSFPANQLSRAFEFCIFFFMHPLHLLIRKEKKKS